MRQHQIIALEKGVKSKTQALITKLYHLVQKGELFTGHTKTYKPKDENGDKLPDDNKYVQERVDLMLAEAEKGFVELFDLILTKDAGNQAAKADLVIGETTLVKDVPVTTLIFLEKQLTDLRTFVSKIPLLDVADRWTYDGTNKLWRTEPTETTRTRKKPTVLVKAPPTQHHPAQTERIDVDEVAGTWSTVKFSGAMPPSRQKQIIDRIDNLMKATKLARENANMVEVTNKKMGEAIFLYLLSE